MIENAGLDATTQANVKLQLAAMAEQEKPSVEVNKLGIKKLFTGSHGPQCDGMVERLNRTLLKDLRGFIDPDDKNWAELQPGSCLCYNTTVHSATSRAPFSATFGVEAFDWNIELGLREQLDDRNVVDLPARMRLLHEEIF